MIAIEQDVRADERSKVLDQVEAALFRCVIGLSGEDATRVAEHNRRMKHFMQLSAAFAHVFPNEWPNRP